MAHQPEQTIAYRVYFQGKDLLGVANVDMPEVKYVTETISGSGVAGEYESGTLGMTESMTCKLSWISQTDEFYRLLDPTEQPLLECYASLQRNDETTGIRKSVSQKLTMLVQTKSSTLGTLETGKKHGNESEFEVLRLEVELNGSEVLLIDKLNFIHRVRGKDLLSSVRAHLGLES